MKKTLSVFLASLLALAMVFSMAYVETPETSDKNQLDLVSIKAVDVQNSVTGIRAYADIVDTTRAYQVNDVIYLAATVAVKNIGLAANKNLKSIKDKNIDLIVGSPDIDLSYSKASNPVILSAIYSGYSDTNIGLVGLPGVSAAASEVINISSIADYDKDKNEVTVTFRGRELNTTSAIEYMNIGATTTTDGKISIPALRATSDKEYTFQIGTQKYSYTYDAPKEVQYTLILTGVTKDNSGKAKGDFYAKIQVKGAEEFEAHSYYYVNALGEVITDITGLVNMKDYMKVSIDKLEIENGYSVYKYSVPASGVVADIPIIYDGDATINSGQSDILAMVNPAKWDYNTGKTPKTDDSYTAGGVNTEKAINNAQNTSQNSPKTSLVYTDNKTYYAPYYYNGIALADVSDTSGGNQTVIKKNLIDSTNNITFSEATVTAKQDAAAIDGYVAYFTDSASVTAQQIYNKLNPITIANGSNLVTDQRYEDAVAAYKAYYTEAKISELFYDVAQGWVISYNAANNTTARLIGGDQFFFGAAINVAATSPTLFGGIFAKKLVSNQNFNNLFAKYITSTDNYSVDAKLIAEGKLPQDLIDAAMAVLTDFNSDMVVADCPITFGVSTAASPTAAIPVTAAAASLPFNGPAAATSVQLDFDAKLKLATDVAAAEATLTTAPVAPELVTAVASVASTESSAIQALTATLMLADKEGAKNTLQAFIDKQTDIESAINAIPDSATVTAATKFTAKQELAGIVAAARYLQSVLDVKVPSTASATASLVANPFPYWAYDLSYLPQNVKTNAVALATYVKNGTQIAISVVPTNKTNTNWNVNVTYDNVTKVASITGSTTTQQDVTLYGLFSPASVNLNLPADTTFEIVDASGNTYKSGTDFEVYTEKNTNGTIKRVGFLFDNGTTYPTWYATTNASGGYTVKTFAGIYAVYYSGGIAQAGTAIGTHADVVDNNGIAVYTITEPTNDRPVISIATEMTYYEGDLGYGICLFENAHTWVSTSGTSNVQGLKAERIYRANNANFSNVLTGGYATTSADMYAAVRFFGLDASFGTTYKVLDEDFEKKGSAAAYSEEVTGQFQYGVITVVEDLVDEATEEDPIVDETPDVPDEPDPTPDPVENIPIPRTGDASANMAIALAGAAIIAAAGLMFVLKKSR